jgi:heterodisulfide reductase subunit A
MVSVGRHPNITLLSYSEVVKVSGYVGNFSVTVRHKPRYVNEELCTGCGTCIEKCPWKKIPSEFDLGLGNRSAIYYPFPQAVPRIPVIDTANCAYFKNGKCGACKKFCPREAIDFNDKESYLNIEIGTIILATGFRDFDPRQSPQYGYGRLPNVVTGMEMERQINSGGPTSGKVLLKNGAKPQKIAIVHCVGSRGKEHEYCSRVCCMYSLKLATLIREYVDAEVVEFYRDMRAFGKDYEGFFHRAENHGVKFIRFDGEIRIEKSDDHLAILTTDVYSGEPIDTKVDLAVLATGAEAQSDHNEIGVLFGVSRSSDGFFLEKHPKLAPVETSTDGVFLAGACQGPKDIPDSVAQGGAAAAAALDLLDHGSVELEPFTACIEVDKCGSCHTCEGLCPYGAISMVELNNKKVAQINEVLCKGCGACVAACPAGAATQKGFTNEQILAEIEGILCLGNGRIILRTEYASLLQEKT